MTTIQGPAAPKDPTRKRPFFYIMQEKEIFGAKQTDGRGIQFIYENDNRLINSAQIAGNVTDEEILELLKTTEGFRKLVHSIGVTVDIVTPVSQIQKVRFAFQMYGKTDPYVSGTTLYLDTWGDGAERILKLDDAVWSEDDKEPGQIRFEFPQSGLQARVSVRFYLQDGYTAPPVVEDEAVDTDSPAYSQMIERSLMQTGNMSRLAAAIHKAKQGEDVTLAYIGGSITQGAGAIPIDHQSYAYRSYQSFAEHFGTGRNVHFVKAGVGGTPSELGMLRFDRDVLRDGTVKPDIVVVEFAVNDEGDETKGVCYESLVRKILTLPWHPAVVLLFAVFAYDWNLQDRLAIVGETYELPMVSIKNAVTPQFRLTREEGRVLSKNQFFYDIYHPSNMGHRIMADCLMNLWNKAAAYAGTDHTDELLDSRIAIRNQWGKGSDFEQVKLLDRKQIPQGVSISCGAYDSIDTDLQRVEMDDRLEPVAQFPNNWYKESTENDTFVMKITCRALFLINKDSAAIDVGKADVYVDGKYKLTADPHKNGWTHCNPLLVFSEEQAEEHTVEIRMAAGDVEKKFTILGFGYV